MRDTFLVTGATGFIGSHIVDTLVAKGKQVRVLIRDNTRISNITEHIKRGNIELVYGNLHNVHAIEKALTGCTVICNAAALTDLSASLDALLRTNVFALRAMLEIASHMKIKRFVHISSIGAFNLSRHSINENTPLTPINNYDRSKVEGEKLALAFGREKKLPVTILEPSAVYGPRVRIGFHYLLEVLERGKMRYPVRENTKLNMLYVGDLVQAVEKAISAPEAIGERFIIGDDRSYTYKQILELAAKELGVPPPQKHIPFSIAKCYALLTEAGAKLLGRKPRITVSYFDYITSDMILDISKAKRLLGFKPQYSLEQGMKRMVKWFCDQKKQ
jgi:dihydroflavonol-4-reductase